MNARGLKILAATKLLPLLLLLVLPTVVQAQFTFTTNSGAITITGYGGSGTMIIPNTTNGYPVTGIADNAFASNGSLTNVIIGTNVTSIGYQAFYYCTGLTNLMIPDTVTSIAQYAFYGCGSMTNITIGSGVTSMPAGVFFGCASLLTITVSALNPVFSSLNGVLCNKSQTMLIVYPAGKDVTYTIPNSITNIGDFAFWDSITLTTVTIGTNVTIIGNEAFEFSEGLTSVTIGTNVTYISEGAFYACPNLTSVTIPSSATTIGSEAFGNCSSLTAITVNALNPIYSSVDGVLFNKSQTTLIQYPAGKDVTYTIPNGVTSIGNYAFIFCTSLVSVTIPSSVTSIGDYAFQSCTSLIGVFFEGNIPSADSTVFDSNNNVTVAYYIPGTPGWGATFAGIRAIGKFAIIATANPTHGSVPLTVSFTSAGVDSADKTIANWNWNFGDGSTSTAQTPSHTYTNAGTFSPVLIATNSVGGTVTGIGLGSITVNHALVYSGLVSNGDFEMGDFTGWAFSGDTSYSFVDNSSVSGIMPYSGNYEAALGTSGSLGYLSQTLNTTPGASYALSFWIENPYEAPGEFLVSWNGNTLLDEANPVTSDWTNVQFTVTATRTSTVLQFGFEDDYYYFGLDGISVVPITVSSPQFTSLIYANGQFSLQITGTTGTNYIIQVSTNLSVNNWIPISTNTATGGTFNFTDMHATNASRFYRVVQQ
jgi:PKD repeat protein